ncbi:MAG: hypothetical protein AAFV72_13640 [Cyanobacteria bacterium J06635_1]
MKINQLLGLLILVGGLAVPGLAHARNIVVETGSVSIRVGDDRSVIIDGENYGDSYGDSYDDGYDDGYDNGYDNGYESDIGPDYFYPRWDYDSYRPSRACRHTRNSARQTQRTYGNQVYSQSTVATRVCQ